MTVRPIIVRHPRTFVVVSTFTLVLLLGIVGTVIYLSKIPLPSPVPVVFLPIAVGIALWATITKRWYLLGYRGITASRFVSATTLLPLIVVLILAAATTGGPASLSPTTWFGVIGLVLLVAFVEETLFRSIFLAILSPRVKAQAIIISTLAFTLAHSINVLTGQDLDTTVRQLAFAVAFGLAASSIYLRTGSIWPTLLFHLAFNYIQLTNKNQTSALVDWIMTVILLLGAAWQWVGFRSTRKYPISQQVSV